MKSLIAFSDEATGAGARAGAAGAAATGAGAGAAAGVAAVEAILLRTKMQLLWMQEEKEEEREALAVRKSERRSVFARYSSYVRNRKAVFWVHAPHVHVPKIIISFNTSNRFAIFHFHNFEKMTSPQSGSATFLKVYLFNN